MPILEYIVILLVFVCERKGRMVGLLRAGPTPRKRRNVGKTKKRHLDGQDLSRKLKRARASEKSDSSSESEVEKRPLPKPRIPAEYKYLER